MTWTLDIGVGERPRGTVNIDLIRTSYCNLVADAHALPFKNDVFSKIWCSEVLEHLNNPLNAIKEIKRVLKPNEISIIDFPKPLLTNILMYRFIEFFLNIPFSFLPKHLKHLYLTIKGVRTQNPRYYHKSIITIKMISSELDIIETEEIGDILFNILNKGRKAKYFKNKPKVNTALLVKCMKT